MTPAFRSVAATMLAGFVLAACDPIDPSALRDIEAAAEAAQSSAEALNGRVAGIQAVADDPVGALRTATLGATFTRTPTAEANLFVLTDLQTGCQWLATYGPSQEVVSLAPRTEPNGRDTRQRCIAIRQSDPTTGDGAQ